MESRKLLLDFFPMVYLALIFKPFLLCMIFLGNYPAPPPSSKKENGHLLDGYKERNSNANTKYSY